MFEKATRMKLRFDYKGVCTVEDLWDVPLTGLDSIFKKLNAQVKMAKEESLLSTKSRDEEILDLKISLVRHIVSVRLKERAERQDERAKSEKKQRILDIIADKEDEALKDMSLDDLKKMVA